MAPRSMLAQRSWSLLFRQRLLQPQNCRCGSSNPLWSQPRISQSPRPLLPPTRTRVHQTFPLPWSTPFSTRTPYVPTRPASTVCSDSDSDDDCLDTLGDRELKDQIDLFRASLYPNSTDPLITELNSATSLHEVFGLLHKNREDINETHISQAVLVLWDLQRIFWQYATDRSPEDSYADLHSYMKAMNGHPDFDNLIRLIGECYQQLSHDALTCTLLYLHKMGVSRSHPVMQDLFTRCEREVGSFPVTALSRFFVAASHGFLWSITLGKEAFPIVLTGVDTCEDGEQFRLYTICMSNIHQLVTPELLQKFRNRVRHLMDTGELGPKNPRAVVKVISFLDFPRWSYTNSDTIRDLLLSLRGHVQDLRTSDIIHLNRAIQSQLEPIEILEEIQSFVLGMMEHRDPGSLPVDVLACVLPFSTAGMREKVLEQLLTSHIRSPSFSYTMPILYKILRYLKTISLDMCELFWENTLKFLKHTPSMREDYKLLRICHKYMHFNNNMGGTYRHIKFEDMIGTWLMDIFTNTAAGNVPTKVSRIAAFLLGYGHSLVPSAVMQKLEVMAMQFSIVDCLNLSRGLMIAMELRSSRFKGAQFVDQLVTVSSILSACMRGHLTSRSGISLQEANMLMRTYINMRGVSGTDLFEQLLSQYMNPGTLMTSRLVRDVTFNLVPPRCLAPPTMELMARYVEELTPHLLGETAEKLLFTCYWLGYVPQSESFPQAAADVVYRDRERMSGLSLLQASIGLIFLLHMPIPLIHHIFTVEFLEKIDDEIKLCYSKATYPLKVRQLMMELNRAVCLDYPQADVPWFHTKFCEEQRSLDSIPTSAMHREVLHSLEEVVGGSEFVQKTAYSPYFYKIDYEVVLDEKQRPLRASECRNLEDRQVTRVAVQVLREDAFSTGTVQLRGPALVRRRHLEILGYRQVEVSQPLWQAMYMAEEHARQHFLRDNIWPSSQQDATS